MFIDQEIIGSYDSVGVGLFVLDSFGAAVEALNFGADQVFDAGLWEGAVKDDVECCALVGQLVCPLVSPQSRVGCYPV